MWWANCIPLSSLGAVRVTIVSDASFLHVRAIDK
jgi:hypothetical protein